MRSPKRIAASLAALAFAALAPSACTEDDGPGSEAPCTSGQIRQLPEGCGVCSAGVARQQCTVAGSWQPATCLNAIDADGDGWANDECDVLPGGCCTTERDCVDDDRDIHPGASEGCNELDDDCDGTTDEGCP